MVKFLLDKGADLQMEDKKGVNPTLYAKKQNRLAIANFQNPTANSSANATNIVEHVTFGERSSFKPLFL